MRCLTGQTINNVLYKNATQPGTWFSISDIQNEPEHGALGYGYGGVKVSSVLIKQPHTDRFFYILAHGPRRTEASAFAVTQVQRKILYLAALW